VNPHELMNRLTSLARGAASEALTEQEDRGLERLERALMHRRAENRRRRVALGLGLVAAACAVCVVVWLHARAITFVAIHARSGPNDYVVAEDEGATLHFSDESEVAMAAGSRIRVRHLDANGARLMLEGGDVQVQIRHLPRAAWAIDAGPYVVRVTGTEFALTWKAEEQTLDLALHKGSVSVEGPLADGSIRMVAGQHLVARAREASVSITDLNEPAAPPPVASVSPAPDATGTAPETGSRSASAAAATVRALPVNRAVVSTGAGWSSQLARGDFQGVLDEAQRRGIEKTLTEAALPDLAALADAARYSRRTDIAKAALGAERARFAGSMPAHDAAFFLGGLAESSGDEAAALDGYDTYMRESPNGAYASQALGRKLLLVHKLRGVEEARPIATGYLARFHDGPYADYARKVVQMP
jgi:hypothetical protein